MESSASADGRGTVSEHGLIRAIGTFGLAAGIINITVGGGIFRLPADVAGSLGAAAPIAYLACSLAMGLIVLCFADAGSRISLTGGPYAYVGFAFGPFAGFMTGVLCWLLGTFATAAVSTVFAAGIGRLVPVLASGVGRAGVLMVEFTILAAINIRGVRQGARVGNVLTVVKLFPLVLLALAGLFAMQGKNLRVESLPPPGVLARTSLLLMFAYSGVESALVPGGEVQNPSRTVPRAILLAMVGITTLYVLLQLVSQGVLGAALATSKSAPLAEAAGVAFGGWGRALLLAGATISTLGHNAGMTLAVPRALYAFGRDGYLPRPIAAVHPRFATPHVAIGVQSALVCLLAITSSFEKLAILANVSVLLMYGACCVAAWELRRRGVSQGGTPFQVPLPWLVPWLACAIILWMLSDVHTDEWLALGACLGVAVAIFVATRGNRKQMATS
jgi:amino acid transporter